MELIDDAGNPPNLYVHLDTYHMNIEESSSEHAVGVCGDKLGYFSHSNPSPFLFPLSTAAAGRKNHGSFK